jgi:hypothetical protein
MNTNDIARIASPVAESARATMLLALMDRRSLSEVQTGLERKLGLQA